MGLVRTVDKQSESISVQQSFTTFEIVLTPAQSETPQENGLCDRSKSNEESVGVKSRVDNRSECKLVVSKNFRGFISFLSVGPLLSAVVVAAYTFHMDKFVGS